MTPPRMTPRRIAPRRNAGIDAKSGGLFGKATKCGGVARMAHAKGRDAGCREETSLHRVREDGHAPTPGKSDPTPARDGGGAFSSTAPEHPEPRVTPFAPSGDGGPANGTAPQSEAGGHQATRTSAAHLGVCCKTELAAPTSGASTGPLASPRPARWVVATATSGEALADPTIGSGGGSKSRSSRTPAQGGKCDLHRKSGVARGRPQTSDLPPNGSREATCGRAEPPIPKGFRGSREP
jgi:hypothetical protein